jgi:hypothetical protein
LCEETTPETAMPAMRRAQEPTAPWLVQQSADDGIAALAKALDGQIPLLTHDPSQRGNRE